MPRPCSICVHPRRREIEKGIMEGTPYRILQQHYGPHPTLLTRHKQKHMAQAVAAWQKAQREKLKEAGVAGDVTVVDHLEREAVLSGAAIGAEAERLYRRAVDLLNDAETAGTFQDRAAALRECRSLLESLLKIVTFIQSAADDDVVVVANEALDRQIEAALRSRFNDEGTRIEDAEVLSLPPGQGGES